MRKTYKILINYIFMIKNINIYIHIYIDSSTTAKEWRRENMGFIVFLNIMEIKKMILFGSIFIGC